ncbi:MAG: aldo/keto reductase [Saprospiraceae bacterium]
MNLQERLLIYGCMHLGGAWNNEPVNAEEQKKAFKAIETAYDSGFRFFDHADIYCLGKSEAVFGAFLKENKGLRENIILQSKAGIELGKSYDGSNRYNFSKDYLWQQLNHSLERLQTDYLDVFLLHRPDPLWDVEEVAAIFSRMHTEGLVKNFGVSNMNVAQISLLQSKSDVPIIANQIQLSIGHSGILNEGVDLNSEKYQATGMGGILEFAQAQNIALQIWSPLDRGRFASTDHFEHQNDQLVKEALEKLAKKYNVMPETIQTSWLFNIPGIVQPVIGTTNPERIQACFKALEVSLTREEWYDLWIAGRGKLC